MEQSGSCCWAENLRLLDLMKAVATAERVSALSLWKMVPVMVVLAMMVVMEFSQSIFEVASPQTQVLLVCAADFYSELSELILEVWISAVIVFSLCRGHSHEEFLLLEIGNKWTLLQCSRDPLVAV